MRAIRAIALAIVLLPLGCSSGGSDDATNAPPNPSPPGGVAGGAVAPPAAGNPAPPAGGVTPPAVPTATVSALFVLGDSLSDVGNAAGMADYLLDRPIAPSTVGFCNPADVLVLPRDCEDLFYRKSRVSDGPVAVEHLAEHLGLAELAPSFHIIPSRPSRGTNYAVASAKARGPGVEDLSHQVDMLLLDHAPLPANALYVVMIGGNDAIDAFQTVASSVRNTQVSAAIVTSAVAAIGTNVERLLDFGARRIVVANVPDLASLPAVRSGAQASADPPLLLARASAISDAFDRDLSAFLTRAANDPRWSSPTPPVLVRFDLRAALLAVQLATAAGGGNASDACFDSEAYRQSPQAQRLFHADCAPAAGGLPRFSRFVFWDGIHPAGAAHASIGAALAALVDAESPGS